LPVEEARSRAMIGRKRPSYCMEEAHAVRPSFGEISSPGAQGGATPLSGDLFFVLADAGQLA
jgi:hypothetical protein